ncbi:hypothetical protein LCGC14_0469520 [marine sediment metagenome]|uniref:Uncharacterized protein n=1 Tax=marine sediment metagenome TaxID=412755 RepID=A0A0F9SVD1_9ZZZZ
MSKQYTSQKAIALADKADAEKLKLNMNKLRSLLRRVKPQIEAAAADGHRYICTTYSGSLGEDDIRNFLSSRGFVVVSSYFTLHNMTHSFRITW